MILEVFSSLKDSMILLLTSPIFIFAEVQINSDLCGLHSSFNAFVEE